MAQNHVLELQSQVTQQRQRAAVEAVRRRQSSVGMLWRILLRWRQQALSRVMWRWKQGVDYARFERERSSERLAERRSSAVRFIWRVAVRCERRALSVSFAQWRRRSDYVGRESERARSEAAASAQLVAVEAGRGLCAVRG